MIAKGNSISHGTAALEYDLETDQYRNIPITIV